MSSYSGVYEVLIDWEGDGLFAGSFDDVTADTLGPARTQRGFARANDRVASVGMLRITLDNFANQHGEPWLYTPANAAGSLYGKLLPGRRVQVQVTYDGDTYDLWSGYVASITPDPHEHTVRIDAVDEMNRIAGAKVDLPLQVDKREDEVIDTILATIGSFTTSLDQGRQVMPFVGDTWLAGEVSALTAIRDVCTSSWGRLWAAADGTIVYWNTHHVYEDQSVASSFDGSMVGIDVEYDLANILNKVTVEVSPRKAGSAGSVLWTLQSPLTLSKDEVRVIEARFRDETGGARVAAETVITPVATTDYLPASGMTVNVAATANAAEITLENTSGSALEVTHLQLRGTPLFTYDAVGILAEDAASQAAYGVRETRQRVPVGGSLQYADYLARHLLRLGELRTFVRGLALENLSDVVYKQQLGLDLMDLITLSETATGLDDATYRVISIDHEVQGARHTARLGLEPHNVENYLIVDVGKVDVDRVAPF